MKVLSTYAQAARVLSPYVLAAVGLLALIVATTFFINSEGFGYDFRAYDSAARRIAAGEALYLPGTADAYRAGRFADLYLYPPPAAIAFIPMTALPQEEATLVWMVFRIGLVVASCAALPVSRGARLATLGIAGLSFPVLFDLNIGNVSIVVFALCVVAWRQIDTPIAALAHAALALLRFPFLLYGPLWIAQGRARPLAWTVAAGLAMLVVGIVVVGTNGYADYIALIRDLPSLSTGPNNLSFESAAIAAGLPRVVVDVALPVSFVLGLAAVVFAARRRDQAVAFLVTALATLLVAPFIHPHYLVLLLLPAAWLADRGQWWGLGLPLLGWLPDAVLPLVGPLAIGLLLGASARTDSTTVAPAASIA